MNKLNELTISKKSWHYRLATEYGNFNYWSGIPNMCNYLAKIVRGMIVILCIIALASIYLGGLVNFFSWVVVWMLHGYPGPIDVYGLIILTSTGCAGGAFVVATIVSGIHRYKIRKTFGYTGQPTFFNTMIKSLQDKYCPFLRFEDSDDGK